jgi:ABC-type bacteriocin/lantibiotic exporter with double-glycine peptidase domain
MLGTGFPLGYHTPVGESGIRLSGGRQQWVTIARCYGSRQS